VSLIPFRDSLPVTAEQNGPSAISPRDGFRVDCNSRRSMMDALHLMSYNILSLYGPNFVRKKPIDVCMYF